MSDAREGKRSREPLDAGSFLSTYPEATGEGVHQWTSYG